MTTVSGNDDHIIGEITTDDELGFMAALPADVVLEIFSLVSQQDCLRCMTVCRAWDNVIPQYMQHVWKQLTLGSSDAYKSYKRRERCLGNHVKHVILDASSITPGKSELYCLMQRLLDWECTAIESLEIKTFERITYQDAFIGVLRKLASHLTHLKLPDNLSSVLLPHILNVCPELTHFTALRTGAFDGHDQTFTAKVPVDHDTRLKHLCLGHVMDKDQLECILKRSPDLRCFISEQQRYEISSPHSPVNLDSLLSWCPKISYLSTDFDTLFGLPNTDPYINDDLGLRYLSTTSHCPQDQVARHLAKSQAILEFLSIGNHGPQDDDWSSVFQSLQLPQLHTLAIRGIQLSGDSLVTVLNHCPSLAKLDLFCPDLSLDSATIRSLTTMRYLRSLKYHSKLDNDLSLLTMLERFPALEKFFLYKTTLSVKLPCYFEHPTRLAYLSLVAIKWKHDQEMDSDQDVAYFLQSLALKSNLGSIQVSHGEALGYKSLQALAMVPTLKALNIHIDSAVQDDELLAFIKTLGGTAIETLGLVNTSHLPFATLDALADLPYLSRFVSETGRTDPRSSQRVSKIGLQQILCKSPNLARAHFSNIVIEDDGIELTRGQIEKLIQQQRPRRTGSQVEPYWDFKIGTMRTVTFAGARLTFNVDIKCMVIC
ncbi:hypothetical protein BJV82DRAFT_612545 [Fennellomyces sp. T-0311]|nr:hypothetical protein BJV82DRAFT_612545 [Fennellomyces sp. T-0311]